MNPSSELPAALRDIYLRLHSEAMNGGSEEIPPQPDIPVSNYLDPARWQQERDVLFRKYPLIAAHGSRIAAGESLALDLAGLPVVLTRDDQGEVRAFLNVCRHRGMRLLEPGEARPCKALVCPYHGWTYQLDGSLRHVLHPEFFPELDTGALGLRQLPCAERHGLVWVLPDADGRLDIDNWLGSLGVDFDWLGVSRDRCWRHDETMRAANWKLIIDAFLESYHIRVLHRNTVYPFFLDATALADRIGPHTRSAVARRGIVDHPQPPDEEKPLRDLCSYSHFVFPNAILVFHPDYTSLITVWPDALDQLGWRHTMLVPPDCMDESWRDHWDKSLALIDDGVFQAEDLYAAEGIQIGLASGANDRLRLGAREYLVAEFHRHVEQALTGQPFSE